MLKQFINELSIEITIDAKSPLIIADGRYNKDFLDSCNLDERQKNNAAKTCFVCRNHENDLKSAARTANYNNLNFYIPGSSLRGVLRSQAEKIARTLSKSDSELLSCDPFEVNVENVASLSCGKWHSENNKQLAKVKAYKHICLICKLFGCTASASRIQFSDGSVLGTPAWSLRDGIGIDRFTGGVKSGANFKTLVLDTAKFKHEIKLRNFELWQLGLLFFVLDDFNNGEITLGHASSRGYGKVAVTFDNMSIAYPTKLIEFNDEKIKLVDLGNALSEEQLLAYAVIPGSKPEINCQPAGDSLYAKTFNIQNIDPLREIAKNEWKTHYSQNEFKDLSQIRIIPEEAHNG